MAMTRDEVYDRLHSLLEQFVELVDITCDRIEELEECDLSELEQFNMEKVLAQLEECGKYKGILHCEGEGFENYIPVSVAKQIVRVRGLSEVLGHMEEGQ